MVTKFTAFKNSNKRAWQTFHRVEGPGKTLLNLLELFPFSSKKNKLIKFNSDKDLHLYLLIDYRRLFLNYKKKIKEVKKKMLLKLKKTRFRILNKYFKMLIFLINFLNTSFSILINNFFYFKSNNSYLNKNICYEIKKKKNYLFNNLSDTNNENLNFYILMNNGLFEFIGHYNDSVLLKLKKKIFLYYYNFFGMSLTFNKLFTKLKYLKNGETFFYSNNISVFSKFIKFLDFFKLVHYNAGIGIKNKNFNLLNKFFKKKKKISNNIIICCYYYYDVGFTTNRFNNNILNEFKNILIFNNVFFFFDIYNYNSDLISISESFLDYKLEINFYFYIQNNNYNLNKLFNNSILICSNFIPINFIDLKNFDDILLIIYEGINSFRKVNYKIAEWYKKFDSMVMFERFRFFNKFYIHDKLSKLRSSLMLFYRIYFYKYVYKSLKTWNWLNHLSKKKKPEITRWLKKIQRFLNEFHNHILKDLIKNFIWKDHKVLNKVIKSHFSWKAKKFINARQASGSYYNAVNFFFIENLNFLKLRLSTNDLIYQDLEIIDELLLENKFISKNDKIKDKRKKKSSAGAKKYYDFLKKQKESKGIFYCKYAKMSYNFNNSKSTKKYLFKLSKIIIPLKTYYKLYDNYIFNLNNFNNNKDLKKN